MGVVPLLTGPYCILDCPANGGKMSDSTGLFGIEMAVFTYLFENSGFYI